MYKDLSDTKILMVTPSYDPIIGGTEVAVKNFSVELKKQGLHVDILTYNMDKRWKPKKENYTERKNKMTITKIGGLNLFSNSSINPLAKTFLINVIPLSSLSKIMDNYDILHFHDDMDLSLPIFSAKVKRPKIYHYHTLQITYGFYQKNFLARQMLKRIFTFHICNSSSSQELLKGLGIKPKFSNVIYNGVDTNLFEPDSSKKNDRLLLYVGRIGYRKGLHILLEAVEYLENDFELKIIGPIYNEKYFKTLQRKIISLKNKGKNVDYLGPIAFEKLVEWYQKASIFICPSLQEPLGIVNLEALSCGTPVIASNVGGIPEIIRTGYNGILVPPGDPKALAKAIDLLLGDNVKVERFGFNGRKSVLKNYSWSTVTENLIKSYCKLGE